MKAVRFDEYGDSSVLHIRDVNVIPPTSGQVLVKVQYAGINQGEIVIREGAMRDFFPARFPGEGQGSDFAGSIVELGTGVDHLRVGEAVIGMSDKRSAHAEYVTIAANRVVPMPKGLDPRVAASLYVAATTAQATVDTVAPQPGETVAVSAAAGGVGILASQLARRTGADVIGIAGPSSAQALRDLGIQPVEYGEGLVERLREAAPRIDAFIDCFGHGYVETALDLGVAPERVATIVDFGTAQRFGVPVVVGTSAAMDPTAVVSRIARLIAAGELSLPIRAVYPFDEVRAAYDDLATRHGVGKIVLSVG